MSRWATPAGRSVAADDGTLFQLDGYDSLVGVGSANSVDATIRRNNAPSSIKHLTGASGTAAYQSWQWGLQGNIGWSVRRYLYFSTLPSSAKMDVLRLSDNNGTHFVIARVTTASKVQLVWNDGSDHQEGSDSAMVLQTGRWYRFEIYGKYDATGTSCEVGLRIADDTENQEIVAERKGLTITTNNVTLVAWGIVANTDGSMQVNSCDGAINNDQGSSQNSYPGPCQNVLYLLPAADSAVGANWLNGAGGSTNLWSAVDNLPPVGVADGSSTATSQIKNAATADNVQNYDATMQTYLAAGFTTGYVRVVQQAIVVGSSTTVNVSLGIQLVSNPAGAEDPLTANRSAAVGTYGSNWRTFWGTALLFPPDADPDPTVAPVARVGRRSASSQAGTLEVALMLIAVEIQPIPMIYTRSLTVLKGP